MKRLNPATGKPFEHGEMRADGKQFGGYHKKVKKNGYFTENWIDAKNFNLITCFNDAKKRAKKHKLPFDLDRNYLKSIETTHCPVFGTPFNLGRMGEGYNTKDSPSLDRIIPEYGDLKGNVVFISNLANSIKQNVTEKELYVVANWLRDKRKEVLDVFKDRPAPVPAKFDKQSTDDRQLGFVFTPWAGQDDYDLNDYNRAIYWQNTHSGPQESGGDSVGHGDAEMEPSEAHQDCENFGQPQSTVGSVEEFFERVHRQSRELDLATRTEHKV